MTLIPEQPAPDSPDERELSSPPRAKAPGLSWIDLLLLVVVLGALVTLRAVADMSLPQAIAIVGAGGLLSVELRRRLS